MGLDRFFALLQPTLFFHFGKRYKFQRSSFQVESGRAASKFITAISKANPAVLTIPAHGYIVGQPVFIDADDGIIEDIKKKKSVYINDSW